MGDGEAFGSCLNLPLLHPDSLERAHTPISGSLSCSNSASLMAYGPIPTGTSDNLSWGEIQSASSEMLAEMTRVPSEASRRVTPPVVGLTPRTDCKEHQGAVTVGETGRRAHSCAALLEITSSLRIHLQRSRLPRKDEVQARDQGRRTEEGAHSHDGL